MPAFKLSKKDTNLLGWSGDQTLLSDIKKEDRRRLKSIFSARQKAKTLAANIVAQRKDGVLKKIFSRIAYKKGRSAAITAVARRLAEIFWIMTVRKQKYQPKNEQLYEEQIKRNVIKNIHKKIKRFGLTTEDILV